MTREMKDSGVKSIGKIPKEWVISQLTNIAKIQTGNTPKGDVFTENNGIEWIKTNNLLGNDGVSESERKIKYEFAEKARIAPAGSTLVCCIGDIGKNGYISRESAYNQQINAITFDSRINDKFGFYSLSAQKQQHKANANGNVLWILNSENHKKIKIAFPENIDVQEKIANFLDEKTAEIDKIISNTEKSIEELEKYKQSLITETVTKGLNPNVPMKDSGIEWIGEIPEHWVIVRIKNLYTLNGRIGWQGLTTKDYIFEGPHLITGTDFEDGKINWNNTAHISEERFDEAPEIHIKERDLLITKDGTVGKVALAVNAPDKVSLNSGVMLIRENKKYKNSSHREFLYYILLSDVFWTWYNMSDMGGSTIKHLYQGQFYNFSFPLPPKKEQEEIYNFLNNRIRLIDEIISEKQKTIVELKSYKQSLIYEYVTGKKEVK